MAWVRPNFVALFYLNQSSQPLEKQIDHNQRQPHRYLRLWASGDPRFILQGENRLKDSCAVLFDSFQFLLVISVVSASCGASVRPINTHGKTGCMLVIPDIFFRALQTFNCTIIDMMYVALNHASRTVPVSLDPRLADKNDAAFHALMRNLQDYIAHGNSTNLDFLKSRMPMPTKEYLTNIILPLVGSRGPADSEEGRFISDDIRKLAAIFGDMSHAELLLLSSGVALLLNKAEAPDFNKSLCIKVTGGHYTFVLWATRMGTRQQVTSLEEALTASKGADGKAESSVIGYWNWGEGDNYFYPKLVTLPFAGKIAPQTDKLVTALAQLANGPTP